MNMQGKEDLLLILNEQTFPIIEQITMGMPGVFFVYRADEEEELIYTNNALIQLYGCDTLEEFKEFTGYTFRGLVHPDDLDRVEQSIAHQIENDENNLDYEEYRIICKDGSIRWVEDYGHFVHTDTYGDVFYVFLEDATERYLNMQKAAQVEELLEEKRKALEKLEHETTALRIVHEILESGMWSMEFDENGRMESVFWSDEFRRMVGYKDEIDFPNVLESWSDLLHEDEKEHVMSEYYSTIEDRTGKKIYDVEYRLLTKNREYRWFRAAGKLSRRGDGTPISYIGIFVDITESKRMDREFREQKRMLEDALKQAQRSNRAKTVFLNNMSHDIRTPMNAIIGFTDLAVSRIDNKEAVADYLSKIMTSSRHLLSLINNVLDMSHIESGKVHLEEKEYNILDIIHEQAAMVQADVGARQIDFSIETRDIVHEEVICDKLRLNQILLNVVGNALKFTPPKGSVRVYVAEKADAPDGYACYEFRIRDTGIGMSRDFLKDIFEPFERERTSTVSKTQGTGLGMAITKSFVDMMKGTITAESEVGKGTEFKIVLSFRLPDETGRFSKKEEADGIYAEDEKADDAGSFGEGKTILLAEDNELNQEIAVAVLEERGFAVDVADDGAIAVEKIREAEPGTYDLILMDIQMPVMNGYEAAEKIRELDEERSRVPIFAMTANAFDEDKKQALEAGMNGHIGKPIEMDKLDRILKSL
ncbi:MAG: PAS domain-containing protein [Dorea sp.]|nr:PAS domain-containing protein [Dorea sp.]